MLTLGEFCRILEPEESDSESHSPEDYENKMRIKYKEVFKDNLKYPNAQLGNNEIKWEDDDQIFVFVDFVKPGRQTYIINYGEELLTLHHFIANPSQSDVLVNRKQIARNVMKRVFNKNSSVFKEWKEDNSATLKKATELEIVYWKVPKFVKDENEQE